LLYLDWLHQLPLITPYVHMRLERLKLRLREEAFE